MTRSPGQSDTGFTFSTRESWFRVIDIEQSVHLVDIMNPNSRFIVSIGRQAVSVPILLCPV